jgi:hypothetical protein
MDQKESFDIAIAGGSLAGVLTALRIRSIAPHLTIVVLEQEDQLGGRLVSKSLPATAEPSPFPRPQQSVGYGLGHVSEAIVRYWTQCLQIPNTPLSPPETLGRMGRFGILSGSKLSEIPLSDFLSEKTAKALGGPAAVRDWTHVTKIFEKIETQERSQEKSHEETQPARPQTIGNLWNGPRKSPAAVVLEHLANLCGIPDLWAASPLALRSRSQRLAQLPFYGDLASALGESMVWADTAFPALNNDGATTPPPMTQLRNMILSARWADRFWELRCEQNIIHAKALVVAQSPWNALHWLPKGFWPAPILQIALKTKPVSLVVLSEQILDAQISLPDIGLIPAERTQFVVGQGKGEIREICFQATIDYELSMQAPAVIKAVKALKRSRKKLLAVYPGAFSEFGPIALQPDAWAQSPALADLKWQERLGSKPLATSKLAFVGDAYGPSHNGDTNILFSVSQAVSALAVKEDSSLIPPFSSEVAETDTLSGFSPTPTQANLPGVDP